MTAAAESTRRAVDRGRRGLFPLLCAALLGAAAVAAHAQDTPGGEGAPQEQEIPWVRTFELGGGYVDYTDLDEDGNAQFLRLFWSKVNFADLRIDLGRQERFGLTSNGVNATLLRHLENKTRLSVGVGASTGRLAPELAVRFAVGHPFLDVIWDLGVAHEEWEGGSRSTDKISLSAQRWLTHWIVTGSLGYELADPGDTESTSLNLGLTYYQWKKIYVTLGYSFGDLNYVVLETGSDLVQTESEGFNLAFSRWFDQKKGINVNLGSGSPPDSVGITVSWFQQF